MLIRFESTSATIDVPNDSVFLGALKAVAFDWPFHEVRDAEAPIVTVRAQGSHYEIAAPGEEPFMATAVSAACSVIVDAVKAAIEANASRLCFHGGSVLLGGQLVLLTGPFRAGKSMLIAQLAANGRTIFGDDVLPLDDSDMEGLAIGIAPRLRLPLPGNVSTAFREFVARHATVKDKRYLYFRPSVLAPRGARAPLGAVVLLDRCIDGTAEIFRTTHGAALRSLILRNFSRAEPAGELLERLHRAAERVPCFLLRYSELEEAASLLERVFAAGAPPPELYPVAEGQPPGNKMWESPGPVLDRDGSVRRNPTVRMRAVDGEVFLTDAEGWGIFSLGDSGAGLWRLLEQPISQREAVDVMAGAFPAVPRNVIERDVSALFAALHAQGFVIEADQTTDCVGPVGRT